jgi:ABC-2 type transport system permease protein
MNTGALARIWGVVHWEWQGFFRRPVGYLMLLAGVLISAWSFAWLVTLIARGGGTALVQANDPIVQFLGPNIFLTGFSTLVVPLLTMNLVADERRRGTLELLLTTPVSTGEALAGKFLASWGLFLAMLAPWGIHLLVLRTWSGATSMLWDAIPVPSGSGLPFDAGIILGGAIGLALLAGTQIAIGLLCSSACRRPVVAALATFAALLALLALGVLPRVLEIWGFPRERLDWIEGLSPWNHLAEFSRGKLLPRVFVGHVSGWLCLLGLAARVSRHADEGD